MMIIQRPSPNHGARRRGVDMLLLHYTGMASAADALTRLCDPNSGVSAHYFIDEDGHIFQLVDEGRRAQHAGVGFWQGNRDTNSRAIGIEIVNPGHEWGYRPFPKAQITAVIALSQDIISRHNIPSRLVLGHSDIAPDRKMDPGELFPWDLLAENSIGIKPPLIPKAGRLLVAAGDDGAAVVTAQSLLAQIGYDSKVNGCWGPRSQINMIAFQRHFYPRRLDGLVDEGGMQALEELQAKYDPMN